MEKNLLKQFSNITYKHQQFSLQKVKKQTSLKGLLDEMNQPLEALRNDLLSPRPETILKIMFSVREMN